MPPGGPRDPANRYGHHRRLDGVAADSLQRVREEMHTAINGRLDAVSSISGAMQRLAAGLAETAKPYRISDLTPKCWDGSHDKGQFRNFMAELHLWMQAWSDQVERILVKVEGVDKVERSTLAVDCTEQTSDHSKPLRARSSTGRQHTNHKGWFNKRRVIEDLEAWHMIARHTNFHTHNTLHT